MNRFLILTSIFFLGRLTAEAQKDSLFRSISLGYCMHNDDNPVSNKKDYILRNRDDHGLTLQFNFISEIKLILFRKGETKIKFDYYSGLYTKGLGTTTIIPESDPDYKYYSYLLEKHPDWSNVYVNNQVSVSKTVNYLSIQNQYQLIGIGIDMKHTIIDSDKNQLAVNVQRKLHQILKARNYYHKPFIDSSVFRGNRVTYFSFTPTVSMLKFFIFSKFAHLKFYCEGGSWINGINEYQFPRISPYIRGSGIIGFAKPMIDNIKRFHLGCEIYFEPLEKLPLYSDPGTVGHYGFSFDINLLGRKVDKINEGKRYYMLYTITPYSIIVPMGLNEDDLINYFPPESDKRIIEGFFNFSAALCFR